MCLSSRGVGWVEVVGAAIAGTMAYTNEEWAVLILAVLFVVVGIFRVTEKKGRR